MATTAQAWKIEEAREEFVGRCVADPLAFVDALISGVKHHPKAAADIHRAIIGSGPTRRPVEADDLDEPTPEQLAALAPHLKSVKASSDIVYPQPLQVGGRVVLVDAKKGEPVAVLGGSTLSFRAIAALIKPGTVEQDLDAISQAILSQYAGPMTQKSLGSRDIRITPSKRVAPVDKSQDIAEQVVMAIQSTWVKGGDVIRARNEEPLTYAKRLYKACKASRTREAKEAVKLVHGQIPETKTW